LCAFFNAQGFLRLIYLPNSYLFSPVSARLTDWGWL